MLLVVPQFARKVGQLDINDGIVAFIPLEALSARVLHQKCTAYSHLSPQSSAMSTSELKFSLYRVPLSTVLEWPQANTIDPESRHWFIPYASVLEILSTLVLAARLWTRVGRTGGGLGRDDILIVLAWVRALPLV